VLLLIGSARRGRGRPREPAAQQRTEEHRQVVRVRHDRTVGPGALLWQDDGMSFLLQNAGDKDAATQLAARVEP
jgi:hypothetical protein